MKDTAAFNALPPDIPHQIDGYEVKQYLGSGAFGNGLLVKVANEQDEAFLKIIKSDAPINAVERLENEIWAMKALNGHDGFVKFISDGLFEGRRYYVSTLAKGETLRKVQATHIAEHGSPLGPRFVCLIGEKICKAIKFMDSIALMHRDLKDDNITSTASGNDITIIDFGSCKATSAPNQDLTWQNPGATRFSPPSRDQVPSFVHSTHDVYSVGILLYYLLTNSFPFEVDKSSGPNALTAKKLESRHTRAWQINNQIPQSLSELIDNMIVPEDSRRLSVSDAMARLEAERTALERQAAKPSLKQHGKIAFTEVVRDPLHGDIRLTDTEFKIIHSPEFIRLRKLKQLGFAYIPFPGAEHTRYLHSLGCLFVTESILRSIEDVTGTAISPQNRLLARAYALLHDITHLPFGHTLEDELGLFDRHDYNYRRATRTILNEGTTLGKLLFSSEINRVRDFFQKDWSNNRLSGFKELLESVVGADVIDYIDRDAYFCGLDHRVDSAIYRRFRLRSSYSEEVEGSFYTTLYGGQGLRLDAAFASETIFLNRFALYLKVYTHPRKLCAGAMLGKAVWEHIHFGRGVDEFESTLEQMGDTEMLSLLAKRGRTNLAKELGKMLDDETLFVPVYRASLMRKDESDYVAYRSNQDRFKQKGWLSPEGRYEIEKKISRSVRSVPESRIIVYIPPKPPGYNKLRHWVESQEGKVEEQAESYPTHRRILERHLALWKICVFCHPEVNAEARAQLTQTSVEFFGIENEIPPHFGQSFLLSNP